MRKNICYLTVFFLLFMTLIQVGFSQETRDVKTAQITQESIKRGGDTLLIKLGLTGNQRKELILLNSEFRNQLDLLGELDPANKEQGAKRAQLFIAREDKIRNILTVEQYKRYKELLDSQREKLKKK